MILVADATGPVGSELVRLLAEQGAPARTLVHSPDKAAPIKRLGLEVAVGELEQPDTLDTATKGCEQLFLLSPATPRQPQQEQRLIDAANAPEPAAWVAAVSQVAGVRMGHRRLPSRVRGSGPC